MQIFEYPYVIITILVFCFMIAGAIGLYFAVKGYKNANGMAEKGFCRIGHLENEYKRLQLRGTMRCLVYVNMSAEEMIRYNQQPKAMRILSQIQKILYRVFLENNGNLISNYTTFNFAILAVSNPEKTEMLIKRCKTEINRMISINEAASSVNVNMGIYSTDSTESDFETALSRAKQACTMAEEKDIFWCSWDRESGKEFVRKTKIENTIQNEIENNRFFLEYQPIIDSVTGKPVGAEVLARLNSKEDGILSPKMFLSAVTNVGLSKKFDYHIFEKNCKWISNSRENREKYVYTINFSRATLCHRSFADEIMLIIEKYGIKPYCVAVEILEDKNLSAEEKAVMRDNIKKLREHGILILLDDFGGGYTSFNDLNDFGIDIVKIDKSITQNCLTPSGLLILKNIIRTAKELGFKTLCEGVETKEHDAVIKEAGCDMIQGYYYYRPMPVTQLEKLFENNQ